MDMLLIVFVFLGAFGGFLIGAIPGLSVSMAMSLLVSLTYTWDTKLAIALAMGIYVVGVYAGSYAAILLNIPGAPGSVVTALDGYAMTLRQQSRQAILLATIYSFVGSVVSFLALFLLAQPLSKIALAFRPHDFLLVAVLSLLVLLRLEHRHLFSTLCSMLAGFLFSQIGTDPIWGQARLTLNLPALQGGIALVPVLIGVFGLAEAILQMNVHADADIEKKSDLRVRPDAGEDDKEKRNCTAARKQAQNGVNKTEYPTICNQATPKKGWRSLFVYKSLAVWSSMIGTLVGVLPGAGAPVAAFFAYAYAGKKQGRRKPALGEGAPEGVVASEAANNACVGGALIPLLTLGIPGDAVTAILLATFTLHGLRPGPLFLTENKDIFYVLCVAGLLASLCILLCGAVVQRFVHHLFAIPRHFLFPAVIVFCVLGAYTTNQRLADILIMIFFAGVGILLRKASFSVPAFILAFVLGGMIDLNFRRSLSLLIVEENVWLYLGRGYITPVLLILLGIVCLSWLRPARNSGLIRRYKK